MQIHTPTVVKGGGGGVNRTPPQNFRYVARFRNDFAFDLLNKMRYILRLVAQLKASDVTSCDCHLGFYHELEIRLKSR